MLVPPRFLQGWTSLISNLDLVPVAAKENFQTQGWS